MNTELTWKKGLFNCSYNLMAGGITIGSLKEKKFSQSAIGQIDNRRYKFRMRNSFKQQVDIIDLDQEEVIGEISFNCWRPKAVIKLHDQVLFWKFTNIWETRWSLFRTDGTQLQFSGCSIKGRIEMNDRDDLMVLIGLYISNYYWQLVAIYMAVFFPIIFAI